MHVSRKRYRPLDSAEERAVHANQRVELLPLDDEQSYCFSWPESPLTQWLRENTHYATLHQLVTTTAGVSGVGSGAGWSGDGAHASGSADLVAGSTGAVAGGRKEALANLVGASLPPVSPHAASTGGASGAAALLSFPSSLSSARRQVELPPVHMLDDVADVYCTASGQAASGGFRTTHADGASAADEVQALLQRLRCEIDAIHMSESASGRSTDENAWPASTTCTRRSSNQRGGATSVPRPASITIPDDAPRAVPHPLAPPRPQSVTEDSIFSLSETQLADLAMSGVPALCAAEEQQEEERQQRQHGGNDTAHTSNAHSAEARHDGGEEAAQQASQPAMVVVVEEAMLCDGDVSLSETSRRRLGRPGQQQQQRQQQQSPPPRQIFPEAYRRMIEHEVAGLEWRTWTQSQRTAAALQRLLSLEAAVPFEPSGDAPRDAWRAVVYRLWLQWRQQVPHDSDWKTEPLSPTTSRVRFSAASGTPSAALVQPPCSLGYTQSHRLPWGAPLLAGAYLYGTSNDYFICLPPSTAAAVATPGTAASASSSPAAVASGASVWPAMSRRRGAYSFLRWKVELHQAQLSHTAATEVGKTLKEEEETEQPQRPNRYAKGPLGLSDTFASGRPRRHSAVEASTSASVAPVSNPTTASPSPPPPLPTATSPSLSTAHSMMSPAQIKALVQATVLTQPFAELQLDEEPNAVRERLACPDLRHDTDAWRVWLSKV